MSERILVSRCLLGENCRYDGGHNRCAAVIDFLRGKEYWSVCPEQDGGLPTPREPSERSQGRVLARDGRDVTANFEAGAQAALTLSKRIKATLWLGKDKSPSCGVHRIYDGTFHHYTVAGEGVTTALLRRNGLTVLAETDLIDSRPENAE